MNFLRLPALGLLLTLAACSSDDQKDDPTPTTPATPAAGLRWTEGGTTYTATQPLFYLVATTSMVSISGSHTASGLTRSIGINVPQAVGTYSLSAPASGTTINLGMYTIAGNGTSGIYAASGPSQGSGTVTITSISPTSVVGTFSFRAEDRGTPVTSKTITEGQFNLTK